MRFASMAKITVKKRHSIRKSATADLRHRLEEEIGESARLFSADRIERVDTDTAVRIYLLDRRPLLLEYDGEGWIFPTVRGCIERPFPERRVVVDQGAIRFVANGADIMRPGIVSVSPDIRAGAPAQVVEERHGKPLAVAVALFDADDVESLEKGKAFRNVHYVGDEIWNLDL